MSLKYRLGSLGWHNFETLVQTLLKQLIGPGVTSFGGAKDGGRDAAYRGRADFPSTQERWEGAWTFQVKYVDFEEQPATSTRNQLLGMVRKEAQTNSSKLTGSLGNANRVDNYVLITNVSVTATDRQDIADVIQATGFAGHFVLIDGSEVCQYLDTYPNIRKSYPQLIGLCDIEAILTKDLQSRSAAYLAEWQPRLAAFVRTAAYDEAARALNHHNFAILHGPPESGKSAIAAVLALLYASDGYEVIDIHDPDEVFRAMAPDRSQLFVADDAVGSISFDPTRADMWSRDLGKIVKTLNATHKLLWTTRKYVLEEALSVSRLSESVAPLREAVAVLVDPHGLSQLQRAEILYNHARQRQLDDSSRALIRQCATNIVKHRSFTPERVRQLVDGLARRNVAAGEVTLRSWSDISDFLNDPGDRWVRLYRNLTPSEQTLLEVVLESGVAITVREAESNFNARSADKQAETLKFNECITRLEHSFIRVTQTYSSGRLIDFQHPFIRDILILQLKDTPKARQAFLKLASPAGVAQLILGLATQESLPGAAESTKHLMAPTSADELELLRNRITQIFSHPMEWARCRDILASTSHLPPTVPGSNVIQDYRFTSLPQKNQLRPVSEVDLDTFQDTSRGQVLHSVLQAIGHNNTFEANSLWTLEQWFQIVQDFYRVAVYTDPPSRISFLRRLATSMPNQHSAVSLKFYLLVERVEPLVSSQVVTPGFLAMKFQELEERINGLIATGTVWSEWDYEREGEIDYSEVATWRSDAKLSVELVGAFEATLGVTAAPSVEELNSLLEEVSLPEPDDDDDRRWFLDRESEGDWTVEKIFADL